MLRLLVPWVTVRVAAGAAAPRLVNTGLALVASVMPSGAGILPEASVPAPVQVPGILAVRLHDVADRSRGDLNSDGAIQLNGKLPALIQIGGDIGGRPPHLGSLIVVEECRKGQGKEGADDGQNYGQLSEAETRASPGSIHG